MCGTPSHLTAFAAVLMTLAATIGVSPADAAPSRDVVINSPDDNAERMFNDLPTADDQMLVLTGNDVVDDLSDAALDRQNDGSASKRRWGQSNMALWGKRRLPYTDDLGDDDQLAEVKRKWGQKNMALWGKRGLYASTAEKRKWGQKNMALWGRRK